MFVSRVKEGSDRAAAGGGGRAKAKTTYSSGKLFELIESGIEVS